MSVSTEGRHAMQDKTERGTGTPPAFRLRIVAAVVGLALLLPGAAQWSQREAGTVQDAAGQPMAEAQAEPATVEYFPAQHVNQARDAEGHIQAF